MSAVPDRLDSESQGEIARLRKMSEDILARLREVLHRISELEQQLEVKRRRPNRGK